MSSESAATGSRRTVRIGKYEVLSHIATGGMGAVYRAIDTVENREVALKVLTAEMAARPAMLERFRRECRHAVKMRHENIVTVFEFDEVNGTFFMAMEFVEGIDLHDYIDQKGSLDPEESRQLMIQAARALGHAHGLGIVHRDIKPSNFLIARKNNKAVLKLTDLGLARETQSDEFRVTRAGTTVGTVDYISPEQARDSGLADIRSDIYSLGCTWFHMLAGHPPFPEGGLAERLYKHMEAEPPDVREFNPRASKQLAAVLAKMLAKKPVERYQDPTELLRALNEMTAVAKAPVVRDTVADVALVTTPDTSAPARKPGSGAKKSRDSGLSKKKSGAAAAAKGAVRRAAERRRRFWYVSAAVISVLVLTGVGLGIYFNRAKPTAAVTPTPLVKDKNDDKLDNPSVETKKDPVIKIDPVRDLTPAATRFKPLYKPSEPIDVHRLRDEIEKPWLAAPALPENAAVLRVSRVAETKNDNVCTSLDEACRKAPAEGPFVIEIHDNGPLYATGCVFAGRQVVLRAGKGYRPLLLWEQTGDTPAAFFKVIGGASLTLEALDFAVLLSETSGAHPTLLHVVEGDVTATDCTFSQAGKGTTAVVLARFEAAGKRCRFTRCYARGNQLVALDLSAPAAEVLFDGCLVVGGDQPLFQVHAGKDKPANLRVVRSTFVSAQTLLRLDAVGVGVDEPALDWFGWDALLCRASRVYGGQMVALGDGGAKGVRWRTVNSLYAGWENLLAAPKTGESARNINEWQRLWGLKEGDDSRRDMWPMRENLNVETHPTDEYLPAEKSDVGVASTLSGDKPIGCDIDALPPARKEWLNLIPERSAGAPLALPGDAAPEVPKDDLQAFSGAKLDLSTLNPPDVGIYLQQKLAAQKFGEKVVLHLSFSGAAREIKFTPFAVPAGTSLTIYFESKSTKPDERQPLKLEVVYTNADAVLAVENGTLELTNLEFVLPEVSATHCPPVLLKVRGDLRLQRCRLLTADKKLPSRFEALIDFHGSGETAADKPTNSLVLHYTVLLSYRENPTCVRVFGTGARLLFNQCLFVAAGDGVAFSPGERFAGRVNVQCWFQNCTLAARRSAVVVNDAASATAPTDPIAVRSKDCAFLNPFPGSYTPGLLRSQDGALNRGLLLWQSDGDAFDKRLHYLAGSAAVVLPVNTQRQAQAQWQTIWGAHAVRGLVADAEWPKLTLDAERPWGMNLERLETPPIKMPGLKDRTVGVKIADLGIKKKGP